MQKQSDTSMTPEETFPSVSGAVNYAAYSNYNALGQPGTLTNGNGVSTAYQYHQLELPYHEHNNE